MQTKLNFGNSTVKTNHKITCDNLIEQHVDYIYPVCIYQGNKKCDFDVPEAHLPMCAEYQRTNQPVLRGYTKVLQESSEKNAINNVQVKKKS